MSAQDAPTTDTAAAKAPGTTNKTGNYSYGMSTSNYPNPALVVITPQVCLVQDLATGSQVVVNPSGTRTFEIAQHITVGYPYADSIVVDTRPPKPN